LGDQFGNLLYANGSTNTQIGKYDGTTWTDAFVTISSGQHSMDTYEDLRLIANGTEIAVIDSADALNSAAFTLPSNMTIVALKSGPTGVLIGANFGYQGALILWDASALRAKTPWKWTNGQILAIEKYGENWIVKTKREVLVTNGYTVRRLFGVFDDPLSFKSYDNTNVLPQQMIIINDTLIFSITSQSSGQSYEYGKMKPGIYLYSLSRHAWNYIPVATGNMIGLDIGSLFADINFNNRILIGYKDRQTGKKYIAQLSNTPPIRATYVSEVLGTGRPHYQRIFLGPTDKTAEALVLNLSPLNSITDTAALTFSVALKIYNFTRQLWGKSVTNAALGSSHKDQLQVDGTSSSNFDAHVGDEVTILDGANAGQVAHITTIANDSASNETWTLDSASKRETFVGRSWGSSSRSISSACCQFTVSSVVFHK
jgi:hypothetical protein